MRFCRFVVGVCLILPAAPAVPAADLPPHRTLRILIVSDEVNPHGLPASQLTQPGDLSVALRGAGTIPLPMACSRSPRTSRPTGGALHFYLVVRNDP